MKRSKIQLRLLSFIVLVTLVSVVFAYYPKQTEMKNEKYYQVVMIWVKDPAKFQDYGQKMAPIVAKYGGAGERILSPVSSFYGGKTGVNLTQPHMVNIVYYDSREAYENFENDPDFLKIKHLRAESIDMVAIGGTSKDGALTSGQVADRLYMIEFGYFGDKGKAYKAYEKATKSFNERVGLNKERVIVPDQVWGDIDQPDLVTIKYLDQESNKANLETDPDHPKIEKLYGEAMQDLIWIEGKAAFVNMQ